MGRRVGRLVAALVLLGLCATWGGGPASAHALLAGSTPADGASLEQPPTEVLLTFTEAPDPSLTVVRVLDETGARLEADKPQAVPGQPRQLRVPLATLARGTYTVTWRTTSAADGHTTAGSVAFGIGVAAAPSSAEAGLSAMASPNAASIAGRWLFYVGAALLLGAGVVGVVVVSRPSSTSVWVLNAAWAAVAVGLVLSIADQRTTTRTSFSHLLRSSTGHKLLIQIAALGLLWLGVAWASVLPSRWSLGAVGAGATGAMLARAMAGHAGASSVPWFTVGVQWTHLIAVGAWVGGLLWLLLALRRGDLGQGRAAARRFSSIAAVMLAVVILSGILRALVEVGTWTRLAHTRFGVTLLVKVGLFAVLVGLGAISRRHIGKLALGGSLRGLRRTVRAEVAMGAAVLAATAVLAGFPPPASLAAASKVGGPRSVVVTGSDYGTAVRIRLEVSPGSAGPNRFDVSAADYDSGAPLPAQEVSLRLQLTDRPDVAAATLVLVRDPDTHWRGSGNSLSVDGRWTVIVVVQFPTDAVEVPLELVTLRRSGSSG